MKKVFKLMMMAFVATVMTIGFAACSSDDDDNSANIYTAGFTAMSISGSGSTDPSLKIMTQIENAYKEAGIKESFTASSDAEVKSKAQQAEAKIGTIDWTGCSGSLTYSITNVKSKSTVYSKTFSSK